MTAAPPFAAGLTIRPPVAADLQAVFDLVTLADTREFGEPDYSSDEFSGDWAELDLANDSRLALLPDGRVVGWATVHDEGHHVLLHAEAYVHPEFEGIGVGTTLVRWTEERAAEHVPLAPAGARVKLQNAFNGRNEPALSLFRGLGYIEVRRFWRMQIDLDPAHPPAATPTPDGITLRGVLNEADERLVFAAVDEAFRDHWGYIPKQFDSWSARKKRHGFHPDLWLLVLDGEEVAGALVGTIPPEMGGWINDVAVRRPWRRRGLGEAMLREVFRRYAARGVTPVNLGVDATNPTGATRLYERAGMRVVREFAFYEKELRPGEELSFEDEE
jgi:mycothiol synthase